MSERSPNRIETRRLLLVEATIPLLTAEGEHVAASTGYGRSDSSSHQSESHLPRGKFEELLGAEIASPWPPPLNDDDSRRWMIRYLESNPEPGWGVWFFLLKRGPGERPIAVGNGGYKGAPTRDGSVEIGYSVVPAYQGRGLAAEAISALVGRAFRDPRVHRVIAETMPDNAPSLRVLEKNGFLRAGAGSDPGSVRLQRDR